MSGSWDSFEKSAEKGPGAIVVKIVLLVVVLVILFGVIGYALGWFGEAAQVAQEQFGPKAVLQKYEWFVDQSNRIEKMDKDVSMFEKRAASIDDQYKAYGDDKSKWQPHIQVQYNKERQQAREDLIAVASQRNNLVKEYNASSQKFNWSPFKSKSDRPREQIDEYVVK